MDHALWVKREKGGGKIVTVVFVDGLMNINLPLLNHLLHVLFVSPRVAPLPYYALSCDRGSLERHDLGRRTYPQADHRSSLSPSPLGMEDIRVEGERE